MSKEMWRPMKWDGWGGWGDDGTWTVWTSLGIVKRNRTQFVIICRSVRPDSSTRRPPKQSPRHIIARASLAVEKKENKKVILVKVSFLCFVSDPFSQWNELLSFIIRLLRIYAFRRRQIFALKFWWGSHLMKRQSNGYFHPPNNKLL